MDILENFIELFNLIPSGDNTQPFTYTIKSNTIEINHNHETAKHPYNQNCVASLISFGMIISVAKSIEEQCSIHIEKKISSNLKNQYLWGIFEFNLKELENINYKKIQGLKEKFKKRITNRNLYTKAEIDFDISNSNLFTFKPAFEAGLVGQLVKLENIIFENFQVLRETEKWFRYTFKSARKLRNGMYLKNLNLDPINGLLLKAMTTNYFIFFLLAPYFKLISFIRNYFFIKNVSGYMIFHVKDASEASIIETGEVIFQKWVLLAEHGFVAQPISTSTLVPFIYNYTKSDYDTKMGLKISKTYYQLQQRIDNKLPILWMLRVGKPFLSVPDDSKTFRKEITQIIN